jgi:hypothetical protein
MTALNTYIKCPKRFELEHLAGEKGEPYGHRMHVGTAFDRVVRDVATLKRDTGVSVTDPKALDSMLVDQFVGAGEIEDYGPPAPGEDYWFNAALRTLEEVSQIVTRVRPVLIDAKLSRPVTTASSTSLDVTGTLDLSYRYPQQVIGEYGSHHLRDVKMSGKAPSEWSPVKAALDFQLRTYTWLADATDTPVDTQGWIVGRALKQKSEVLHNAADVSDAAVELTGERLTMIASAIEGDCETGRFLPTASIQQHWSCSEAYCPFHKHICEYGARQVSQVLIEGEAA